jgi:hypothetical protein
LNQTKNSRRAIPAKLRRQILVEASHRCCIPTCGSEVKVDIHHIIPWETCKNHEEENLVALCPNCHRRAGRGDFDRKSLRIYKRTRKNLIFPPDHRVDIKPLAYIKFNPKNVAAIIDAFNIDYSYTDAGRYRFIFSFTKELDTDNYVINASGTGSVSFEVFSKSRTQIGIELCEPLPDLVRLDFKY